MGEKDRLVGMGVYRARGDLVVISELGIGKRSGLSEYPSQGRYGAGVASASLSVKTGPLAAGGVASASDRLMMVSEKGNTKVVFVRSLPKAGRATRGQELIAIRGRDKLANLLFLPPLEGEAAEPAGAGQTRADGAGRRRTTKDEGRRTNDEPSMGREGRRRKTKAEPASQPKPKAGQTGGRKPMRMTNDEPSVGREGRRRKTKAEPSARPKPKAGQTGGRKPKAEPAGQSKPKAPSSGGRKPKAGPASQPKPKVAPAGPAKPKATPSGGRKPPATPAPTPARKRRSTG
jgi:hypothetical protein